tara:strand:+ start:440 stop:1189 length:750 start_codon:yes stop_codon:yes gene_type:complete
MLRVGHLSDDNMRKMCGLNQPVPMHRLDLLPRPMENRSGLYSRPLKQPQILSRPATAGIMVQATEKLTGRDLSADYKKALEKEVKFPVFPKTLAPSKNMPTPVHGVLGRVSLADMGYSNLALMQGVPVSGASLLDELESIPQTESSGFVFDTASVDTPSVSETQSEFEARQELMGEYRIRPETPSEEEEMIPPLPVIQLTQSGESPAPGPSFIGSEMQLQQGRGRPPTVTIPPDIQGELSQKYPKQFYY